MEFLTTLSNLLSILAKIKMRNTLETLNASALMKNMNNALIIMKVLENWLLLHLQYE